MKSKACFRFALIVVGFGLTLSDAQAGEKTYPFNVPAQPLIDAIGKIDDIATDVSILVGKDRELVTRTAPKLDAEVSVEQALEHILRGSSFKAERKSATNIVIVPVDPEPPVVAKRDPKPELPVPIDDAKLSVGSVIVTERVPKAKPNAYPGFFAQGIRFDRAALQMSGARDLGEFLKNKLSPSSSPHNRNGENGETSRIELRALGAEQILILVDGRRLSRYGLAGSWQQMDLSAIPIEAVDHIDVGGPVAGTIQGASAAAGYINVVLRPFRDEVETSAYIEAPFSRQTTNRGATLVAGSELEDSNIQLQLIVNYATEDLLSAHEMPYLEQGLASLWAHDPQRFTSGYAAPLAATANVMSVPEFDPVTLAMVRPLLTLKNGTPLNSSITSGVAGGRGIAADGGMNLVQQAGRFNLQPARTAQLGGGNESLRNGAESSFAWMSLSRDDHSDWTQEIKILASNRRGFVHKNAASPVFRLDPEDPGNPFNQTVMVTAPAWGADQTTDATLTTFSVMASAQGAIGEWHGQMDFTHSQSKYAYSVPGELSLAGIEAVRRGSIDIFSDPQYGLNDFSPYVGGVLEIAPAYSALDGVIATLNGPERNWDGFSSALQFSVEHRAERLRQRKTLSPEGALLSADISGSQKVSGATASVVIGMLPTTEAGYTRNRVSLQAAARYDSYAVRAWGEGDQFSSGRFQTVSPVLQLSFKPIEQITFDMGYASGALPPTPMQRLPGGSQVLSAATAEAMGLGDPRRNYQALGDVVLLTGGSDRVNEQRYKTWAIGVAAQIFTEPILNVSANWMRIHESNVIAPIVLSQATLEREQELPGFVTRAEPPSGDPLGIGEITALHAQLMNVGSHKVDALDLGADLRWETEKWGTWALGARATKMLRNSVQEGPGLLPEDQLEMLGSLKWNAIGDAVWTNGPLDLGWAATYRSGYYVNTEHAVDRSLGVSRIGGQTYYDVFVGYDFDKSSGLGGKARHTSTAWSAGLKVQLKILNVFDKSGQIGLTMAPYVNPWADAAGISGHLSVTKTLP